MGVAKWNRAPAAASARLLTGARHGGRIVETGRAADILKSPRHPYTEGLLSSTVLGAVRGQRIEAIPGMPPNLAHLPPGCAFAPRCPRRTSRCDAAPPPLRALHDERAVACVHVAESPS